MTALQFRGDPSKILWSDKSPQEGDPTCLCSYCGAWIPEDTIALRAWHESKMLGARVTLEARFCDACAASCFGMSPPEECDG
jgi:hypothetical protein